jgi:hypothetical protein
VIWAREETSNQAKGFVVGKDNPGFSVKKIEKQDGVARGPERPHHPERLSRAGTRSIAER